MGADPVGDIRVSLLNLTDGELEVKLALARQAFTYGQTEFCRDKARREIRDIETEVDRRLPDEAA